MIDFANGTIDLLDMDVQGAEDVLIRVGRRANRTLSLEQQAADEEALTTKVRRIHIEAHTPKIAQNLVETLTRLGFRIVGAAAIRRFGMYDTPIGRTVFRAGYIYASNPRFDNTLGGRC